jgi:hypothetical protein
MADDQNEHDSWLAGLGVTGFQASDGNNSMLGAVNDLIKSGQDAYNHATTAGNDLMEARHDAVVGGMEQVDAGLLDAVGAHETAAEVRGRANDMQTRAGNKLQDAGNELGHAKDDVVGRAGGSVGGDVENAAAGAGRAGGGYQGGAAAKVANDAAAAVAAAGGGAGQAMQPDCKPVHGKVPGPANHLLCSSHGHVVDVSTKTVIAASLDDYKKRYPSAGGKSTGKSGGASLGGGAAKASNAAAAAVAAASGAGQGDAAYQGGGAAKAANDAAAAVAAAGDGGSSGGSGSGQAMQPDCKPVHGKVPGPANHLLCSTHGHVVDVSSKTILANSLQEYIQRYPKGGGGGGGGAYGKGGSGGGGGGGAYGKPKEDGYAGGSKGSHGKEKSGGYGGGGGGVGEVPTYQRPESAPSKTDEGESISGVSETKED